MASVDPPKLSRFREKIDKELKSGVLSLLLLLVIDREGPEYGYGILKRLDALGSGALDLKEGTAYPQLKKLERMGLVTSYWGEGSGGPPRKYYQTTELGREALALALADWRAIRDEVDALVETVGEEA